MLVLVIYVLVGVPHKVVWIVFGSCLHKDADKNTIIVLWCVHMLT